MLGPVACGNAPQAETASAATVAATATTGTTGWRFGGGNICLQDWSGGALSDGFATAARWWSLAPDINLFPRKDCKAAGFSLAQTLTIITYRSWDDFYYGTCWRPHVWTQNGYQRPGILTRSVVWVNRECRLMYQEDRIYMVAHAAGIPLGLRDLRAERPGDPTTVMSCAGGPKPPDFRLIEEIYPW